VILSTLLAAGLLASPCNIHPIYALQPVESAMTVRRDGRVYRATANLKFRIVEKQPAVLTSADPGLLDHVRGHQIVAQRVIRSSTGSVQGVGNTAASARLHLKQALTRLESDLQKELDREERVYDSVTNDGASQSQGPLYGFPGGPDAQSSCAQH
jgi:hypothetical protein